MTRLGPPSSTRGMKRQILLCLLLGFGGFIIALWLDSLQPLINQVQGMAHKQGLQLEITRPGRAFPLGLQADKVLVGHQQMAHEPFALSAVDIRPLWSSLFSSNPGLNISARLFAGSLTAEALSNGQLELDLNGLQLRESLGPQLPLQAAGTLTSGSFSGRLPLAGKNQGTLQLKLDDVVLLGLEKLGGGQDRFPLGSVQLKAENRGPVLQVRQLEATGGAVELAGSGTLNLGADAASSRLTLSVILKPTENLDSSLRGLLSLLGQPGRDGTYRFRLTGPLNAIQLR